MGEIADTPHLCRNNHKFLTSRDLLSPFAADLAREWTLDTISPCVNLPKNVLPSDTYRSPCVVSVAQHLRIAKAWSVSRSYGPFPPFLF